MEGNTGLKFVPDLVAITVCKIGTILSPLDNQPIQPLQTTDLDLQPTVFKINFSFGFILHNTETGALQYHHPSANHYLVLIGTAVPGLQS